MSLPVVTVLRDPVIREEETIRGEIYLKNLNVQNTLS